MARSIRFACTAFNLEDSEADGCNDESQSIFQAKHIHEGTGIYRWRGSRSREVVTIRKVVAVQDPSFGVLLRPSLSQRQNVVMQNNWSSGIKGLVNLEPSFLGGFERR
jgi:hypothetical protein